MKFTQHYCAITHEKFPGRRGNIAYNKWGRSGKTILCVHGLTRNSRDFDYLANNLSDVCQVICVDVAGRGRSDWLVDKSYYIYEEYVQDLLLLIDHLSCGLVDFIGTSMGGIIGMIIASRYPEKISKLVLNDIGPYVSGRALTNTRDFLRSALALPGDLGAIEDFLRKMFATFGLKKPEHLSHLIRHSIVMDKDRCYRLHEDPAIIRNFGKGKKIMDSYDMWDIWRKITAPTLVIRGRTSHILSREVAGQMLQLEDAKVDLIEVEAGHTPALMEQEQILLVRQWLLA
ncbi:alpha/beta hydrolase [Rickettsiales bacterium]|nr:alpha/beta hydrolase [Rickettsiales bacterium]